ncbi:UNVERIFIED_ORG: hypothetical protein ABIB52_000993 [Arthrobacter sp. UYCu721]
MDINRVERARADLHRNGQAVTFTAVAAKTGLGRTTLYRNPMIRGVIDGNRHRAAAGGTLTASSTRSPHSAPHSTPFVSSSTWAVEPVRRRLANLAVAAVGPEAWVIDDTGFKKEGPSSPCVARQYSGTLGKIGNCQIGVSVHAATDAASCPLDWRLFVPEAWDDTCAETNEGRLPDPGAAFPGGDPGHGPAPHEMVPGVGND